MAQDHSKRDLGFDTRVVLDRSRVMCWLAFGDEQPHVGQSEIA